MNRIIQYRVRNKNTGELIGYERINNSGHWEQQRLNRQEWLLGVITDGQIALELLREQFTGKIDKKDIPIYDGDINQDKGYVMWGEDSACWLWVFLNGDMHDFMDEQLWCEIIGNKTDNPELLK